MLHLQLYIEGQEVELHDNESVVLTQSLQDVLDIQKVFTDYSRTFNVPASKNNNKIFKHYYNPSIVGTNTQVSRQAELFLNYKPFKSGRIKNESVEIVNGQPSNYRITFLGNTMQLKEIFGDSGLPELFTLNKSIKYDAANVLAKMQDGEDYDISGNQINDALIYPLISNDKRLIYDSTDSTAGTYNLYASGSNHGVVFDQLKPAVRLHAIILAIEKQYGISFSRDFFNSTNLEYYGLYLWLHKQKGGVRPEEQGERTYIAGAAGWTGLTGQHPSLRKGFENASGFTNYYASSNNRYLTISADAPAGVNYSVRVTHASKVVYESDNEGTGTLIGLSDRIQLDKTKTTHAGPRYPRYFIQVSSNTDVTINLSVSVFDGEGGQSVTASQDYTISTSGYNTTVMNEMPNIKVIDLITSLFKMFNLTAYFDGEQIQVLPLDSYYAASQNTYDITKYLDKGKSEVSVSYPFSSISFKYDGLQSFFADFHSTYFNKEWGSVFYENEADFSSDKYEITVPFEHHKFERFLGTTAQWGWSVDKKQEPFLGKPLLFYAHKVTSGTPIQFSETIGGTTHQITNYYIPANNVDPTDNDSQSIHFGAQKNEYTATFSQNSLFYTYYRNYIEEVFDSSRRLFTFKAYLPLSIITNINLNDKVIIFNDLYKINKLTTNFETNVSTLELVNVTQEIVFEPEDIVTETVKTVDASIATADITTITADKTILVW